MTAEAELLLFTASRAQLVRELIAPALARGETVLADRFLDSTTVYQGVARRLPSTSVRFINEFAVGSCRPDLTFILDLDSHAARARIALRPAAPEAKCDRMEQEPLAFYEAVRAGYLQLAQNEPTRFRVLDGGAERAEIEAMIWREVQPLFFTKLMSFSRIEALDLLRRSHAADRLAHAYLITGPEPAETRCLADELAGLVLGNGSAPDAEAIGVFEPESKLRQISVEQTRAIERSLRMRSLSGKRKIALVVDADRMTTPAANAFLKTLEEPPANSLLLLTSSAPETLSDTIRSRCIPITLAPTTRHPALTPRETRLLEALRDFSKKNERTVSGIYGLIQTFTGLLREAREEFAADNAGALKADETHYKQTTGASHWLDDREDFYKALTESRYVRERFALVEIPLKWSADVLRQQAGFTELDFPSMAPDTERLAGVLSPRDALRRVTHMEELRENLNRTGVNEPLAIEVAFLRAFF